MSQDLINVAYGSLNSTETKVMMTDTMNFSKTKLLELKKIVEDGNFSWRIGGLVR